MKAIEIISIPVSNQQASKQFYLNLGFELLMDAPFGNGQNWVQLALPASDVSITLVTWFDNMPPGCIQGLVIKVEDIKKELDDLTAKGIAAGTIDQTPWGKFVSVKDPDGNTISLHQN